MPKFVHNYMHNQMLTHEVVGIMESFNLAHQ